MTNDLRRMLSRAVAVLLGSRPMRLSTLAVVLLSSVASAQVTKSTVNLTFPNCAANPANTTYSVDVYRPGGTGPFGLIGIGHGFQNNKSNHEGLARELAAKGLVVVLPQFPSLLAGQCGASDHSRNANILWAAMQQQITAGGIDTARLGLAGHSAGGLSAFLAASRQAVQAVVLFDAVDNSNLGTAQVANVAEPVLFLNAEPSSCNSQNNNAGWFTGKQGLKAKLKVINALHCEPQDPVSGTCTFGCPGTTVAARQNLFKSYAVAFFDRFLNGVTTPCLETTAAADQTAARVSLVDFQLGGCGSTVDAGQPTFDAGIDAGSPVVDAGTPVVDAGAVDSGTPAVDAGVADAGVADAGAVDAGVADAGDPNRPAIDAGVTPTNDAGSSSGEDGGVDVNPIPSGGCGCGSVELAMWALGVLLLGRRPRI